MTIALAELGISTSPTVTANAAGYVLPMSSARLYEYSFSWMLILSKDGIHCGPFEHSDHLGVKHVFGGKRFLQLGRQFNGNDIEDKLIWNRSCGSTRNNHLST